MITREIQEILEENGGKRLPDFLMTGGYSLLYTNTEGEIFCSECANNLIEDEEETIEQVFVHWEGKDLMCRACGDCLESEYGDPEEE